MLSFLISLFWQSWNPTYLWHHHSGPLLHIYRYGERERERERDHSTGASFSAKAPPPAIWCQGLTLCLHKWHGRCPTQWTLSLASWLGFFPLKNLLFIESATLHWLGKDTCPVFSYLFCHQGYFWGLMPAWLHHSWWQLVFPL